MQDPLLEGYEQGGLTVDKKLLMSFFYKDNREKEGVEMPLAFKKMSINEIIKRLNTSAHNGISQDPKEMEARRQKYGVNTIIPDNSYVDKSGEYADVNLSKDKSLCKYIKEHFDDRIYKILLVCSIMLILISVIEDFHKFLNMKMGNWLIGATFLGLLMTILIIDICIEKWKYNGILKMLRYMESKVEATVIRDGQEFLVGQDELLVGDVIILSGGDSIPADCLVIEANLQAQVDESYLTPDINPVQKKAIKVFEETFEKRVSDSKDGDEVDMPDPFLLASTLCTAGRMKALVCAVGNNTYVRGKNLHSPYYTMMGEKRTVFHSKMDRVVNEIGRYGFVFWVIILVCLMTKLIWMKMHDEENNVVMNNLNLFGGLFYLITYFFVLLVILIPVGLSKAVDNVIIYSIKRLFSENVICLTKAAPENMARINQLCIEKGGTLTTKKMQVVEVDTFDKVHSRLDTIDEARRNCIVSNLAINVVHLNSVGRIVKNLNNENKHIGNRMECAFLEFLSENDVDYRAIRKEAKEILQTNPSTEKRMVMTVVEHPEKEEYLRIYLNGSTDVFLMHCNEILLPDGKKEDFTYSRKEQLESEIITNYKEKCLRVLALGYKDIK